ncbi:hypothetical protein [Desulfosporosinus sp.]|uniref:hypothetical protein n=1 Tax=Desulfosporosinus sp. TaxID=157907 RepID=UPI00262445E2|nr:hypothetical protein [Desulfosporosinus sp.]
MGLKPEEPCCGGSKLLIDSQVVQESTALSILGQPGYELVTLLSPDTYYVNKARAGRKL